MYQQNTEKQTKIGQVKMFLLRCIHFSWMNASWNDWLIYEVLRVLLLDHFCHCFCCFYRRENFFLTSPLPLLLSPTLAFIGKEISSYKDNNFETLNGSAFLSLQACWKIRFGLEQTSHSSILYFKLEFKKSIVAGW